MKLFVKNLIAFTIIMSSLASCQDNTSDEMESLQEEATVSQEEVLSALETVLIEYPIVALEKNASSTQLNDDFDLTTYAATNPKPEIVFPIDVLIDGTLVTINTKEEFKALVKERRGRKKPAFVFPISVILIDESNLEIADKDALKDYLDSLDEGIKPVFTFPLSIEKNGETIVVNNEEELKTFIGKPAKGKRPHLVFPLSVVLEDESSEEMLNKDAFEAYLETLESGVKPVFVYPISIEKNDEIIVINNEEEFMTLVKKPKKGRKTKA